MTFDDMDETARQFLKNLFEQTGGQPSRQVSMYDVGAALGWDRDAASRAAQDLMAMLVKTERPPEPVKEEVKAA